MLPLTIDWLRLCTLPNKGNKGLRFDPKKVHKGPILCLKTLRVPYIKMFMYSFYFHQHSTNPSVFARPLKMTPSIDDVARFSE